MVQTIVKTDANSSLADVIDAVETTDDTVILERDGKPVAVMIPPAVYERMLDSERERDWAAILELRARNADADPEQVFADATEAVNEVRQRRRATSESGD